MRISHQDYRRLLEAIYQLHECHDTREFRRAAPKILLQLIPGEYFLLSDYRLNPPTKSATVIDYFESDPRWTPEAQAFGSQHVFAHPATKYFLEGGEPTAFMQSDFFTQAQFRKSAWADGLRRFTEIDRMISLPVTSGQGNATVMNIGRRGKNFGEHHRMLLNLIRPHYDQACQLAKRRQAANSSPPATSTYGFTPREAEVAHWLAEGKSNPEIAAILSTASRTVDKHVERILGKTGAENRTTAALILSRASCATQPSVGGSR